MSRDEITELEHQKTCLTAFRKKKIFTSIGIKSILRLNILNWTMAISRKDYSNGRRPADPEGTLPQYCRGCEGLTSIGATGPPVVYVSRVTLASTNGAY